MMVKFKSVGSRGILSTGGCDQYSTLEDGADEAQLRLSRDGLLGAHNIFSQEGGGGGVTSRRSFEPRAHAVEADLGHGHHVPAGGSGVGGQARELRLVEEAGEHAPLGRGDAHLDVELPRDLVRSSERGTADLVVRPLHCKEGLVR